MHASRLKSIANANKVLKAYDMGKIPVGTSGVEIGKMLKLSKEQVGRSLAVLKKLKRLNWSTKKTPRKISVLDATPLTNEEYQPPYDWSKWSKKVKSNGKGKRKYTKRAIVPADTKSIDGFEVPIEAVPLVENDVTIVLRGNPKSLAQFWKEMGR